MTAQGLQARSGDATWAALIDLAPDARVQAIQDRYRQLLALSEAEMESALEAMIIAEYALDAAKLHEFTGSRMRALLGIAAGDLAQARRIAGTGDRVFTRMPGSIAMRRTEVVQSIARTELTADEVERLRELLPSLLQQLPRLSTTLRSEGGVAVEPPPAVERPRKPWWKVW
jgi:hypothetical protein